VESSALLAPVAIGELVMNPRWAGSAGDSLRPIAAVWALAADTRFAAIAVDQLGTPSTDTWSNQCRLGP